MKKSYRITGSAGTSKWIAGAVLSDVSSELTRRYNNMARRERLPEIQNCPGEVSGDTHERTEQHDIAYHGARSGHGVVTVEIRRP